LRSALSSSWARAPHLANPANSASCADLFASFTRSLGLLVPRSLGPSVPVFIKSPCGSGMLKLQPARAPGYIRGR
jgi:hypothetical protein